MSHLDLLLFSLIILPVLLGLIVFLLANSKATKVLIYAMSVVLGGAAITLAYSGGSGGYSPEGSWTSIIKVLDFIILSTLLYIAYKLKNVIIGIFTTLQLALIFYFDIFLLEKIGKTDSSLIFIDNLSIIMVLIVSIIGSLIAIFALPYMDKHEQKLQLAKTQQPRFFALILLFLGAMNALVLAGDMALFILAWEITTLCSFLLISHDGTELAIKNATRALMFNSLGGVALVLGLVGYGYLGNTTSINALLETEVLDSYLLIPLALFVLAGFTKSAQMPFQSWLLGAMVAPTPISALLHSSAMVKAGVYLIIRLAPAYQDTYLTYVVALVGAYTFLVTSALAISQSNAKKILAYSTIANLGLIVAAAGINTPIAYTAAIILIVFHAISKALLFLCVGNIDQTIGSKDTEDMHGLYHKMPLTATLALVGIITMFLPPFGMLLGKWATLEAAPEMPLVMLMMVFGSALTIVFWVRWAGNIMTSSVISAKSVEKFSISTQGPLVVLALGAILLSVLINQFFQGLLAPIITYYYPKALEVSGGSVTPVDLISQVGGLLANYMVGPLFLVTVLALVFGLYALLRTDNARVTTVYMCGEIAESEDLAGSRFRSVQDQCSEYQPGNYYLEEYFGEDKLTQKANMLAILLIVALLGVVLA